MSCSSTRTSFISFTGHILLRQFVLQYFGLLMIVDSWILPLHSWGVAKLRSSGVKFRRELNCGGIPANTLDFFNSETQEIPCGPSDRASFLCRWCWGDPLGIFLLYLYHGQKLCPVWEIIWDSLFITRLCLFFNGNVIRLPKAPFFRAIKASWSSSFL
jgi:hypothetical protein